MTTTWTARWANWVVWLQRTEQGWDAKVWRWLLGKPADARHELDMRAAIATHADAIKWACDVMRKDGAVVLVLDAPSMTLESLLQFTPAP